jgi:hypothetical protein
LICCVSKGRDFKPATFGSFCRSLRTTNGRSEPIAALENGGAQLYHGTGVMVALRAE